MVRKFILNSQPRILYLAKIFKCIDRIFRHIKDKKVTSHAQFLEKLLESVPQKNKIVNKSRLEYAGV